MQQLDNVSEVGLALIEQIRAQQAADPRVLGTTADGREMIGCGPRRFTQLMDEGEIVSVLEGRSRRPVIATIYDLICRRVAKSHPAGEAPAKAHDGRALRKRATTQTKTENLKGGASRPRKALAPHEARGGPA